jgi:hypothetical protein
MPKHVWSDGPPHADFEFESKDRIVPAIARANSVQAHVEPRRSMSSNEATPEILLRMALASPEEAYDRFPDYRLTRLVAARFDMNDAEALAFARLAGHTEHDDLKIGPRAFGDHLRWVIIHFGLARLFADDGPRLHHHAIRPKGYDYYAGQVDAVAMERWRAHYRGMRAERQMLAASIVWLYRGGKDNRWLRRVPCTWHAAGAVAVMQQHGVLSAWGTLIRLYPGW